MLQSNRPARMSTWGRLRSRKGPVSSRTCIMEAEHHQLASQPHSPFHCGSDIMPLRRTGSQSSLRQGCSYETCWCWIRPTRLNDEVTSLAERAQSTRQAVAAALWLSSLACTAAGQRPFVQRILSCCSPDGWMAPPKPLSVTELFGQELHGKVCTNPDPKVDLV
jgi:hypothetical protein